MLFIVGHQRNIEFQFLSSYLLSKKRESMNKRNIITKLIDEGFYHLINMILITILIKKSILNYFI